MCVCLLCVHLVASARFEGRQIVFAARRRYGLVSISSTLTANFNPATLNKGSHCCRGVAGNINTSLLDQKSPLRAKPRPWAARGTKGGRRTALNQNQLRRRASGWFKRSGGNAGRRGDTIWRKCRAAAVAAAARLVELQDDSCVRVKQNEILQKWIWAMTALHSGHCQRWQCYYQRRNIRCWQLTEISGLVWIFIGMWPRWWLRLITCF